MMAANINRVSFWQGYCAECKWKGPERKGQKDSVVDMMHHNKSKHKGSK